MPVLEPDRLFALLTSIYRAKGVPPDAADEVAGHQVEANLVGHDSHGAIRTKDYIFRVDEGHVVPSARGEVIEETPTTAVIDGHWGLGFVVMKGAVQVLVDKAEQTGVAAVTVRRQGHIGRLGAYANRISESGLVGLVTADSGLGPKAAAPFGGRERRLGTNPLALSVPSELEGPVCMDMATTAVAGGKLALARSRGETVPPGWIVDSEGRGSTDPNDYFDGGSLLPLGADQAHKGFGLSFMVEVFSGLLTGLGFGFDPKGRHNDGVFMAAFAVERFRPREEFVRDVQRFIAYLKDTPKAPGHDEVLYPGEREHRTKQTRLREGIYVEDGTWAELGRIASDLGVRPS